MISSIFGKTKPINFIIVLSFLFAAYWLVQFLFFEITFEGYQLLTQVVSLVFLLLSIFVVDFIVKRNKITAANSFAILFYTLLFLMFPEALSDENTIICSFFLLLATRKLISIRSLKNIKLKIFDATFWILISSLFYEWTVLYLILVFAAIYIYEPKNTRNWLVPFVAIFTVSVISYVVLVLTNNSTFFNDHYQFIIEFDSAYFSEWNNSTKLICYIAVSLFTFVFAFLKFGKVGLGQIVTMRLIGISFLIGLLLKGLTSAEGVYPILLTFFPAVVFITNYIEALKKSNVKEVVLILSVFFSILIFITSILIKQ